MEDKRKPFNASLAKVGDVVETKLGYKVRIICLDRQQTCSPVVGLLKDSLTGEELVRTYTKEGRYLACEESNYDLFFPLKECTGYINIYGYKYSDGTGSSIFSNEDEAKKSGMESDCYVTTIKITYKK